MTIKFFIQFFIFLVVCNFLFAQPLWLSDQPQSKDFNYYRGVGTAKNKKDAKSNAILDAVKSINLEKSTISSNSKLVEETQEVTGDGDWELLEFKDDDLLPFDFDNKKKKFASINKTKLLEEIEVTGTTKEVDGLRVEEEYFEENTNSIFTSKDNTYTCTVLLRKPKRSLIRWDYNAPQSYGFAPVWRSVFIPGWGQFYKKQKLKGYTFLLSEVLLLSSSVFFLYAENSYRTNGATSSSLSVRKDYYKKADDAKNIAFASVLAAGGLYIYNVFDAILSKGAKRYAMTPQENNFKLTLNERLQLCFAVNF